MLQLKQTIVRNGHTTIISNTKPFHESMSKLNGRQEKYHLSIAVVGDCKCRKTDIIHRFCETKGNFQPSIDQTIGIRYLSTLIQLSEVTVKVDIVDMSGQKRYRDLVLSACRDVDGIILVYDVSQEHTFHNLKQWLNEMKRYGVSGDIVKMIIGNVAFEVGSKREVLRENAESFAYNENIKYNEICSQNGIYCKESLHEFIQLIVYHKVKNETLRQLKIRQKLLHSIKIIIIGDTKCGKTDLMHRFFEKSAYIPADSVTIGVKYGFKKLHIAGTDVQLLLVDASGGKAYRQFSLSCCHGAQGVIFVYDVTQPDTFYNLKDWIGSIEKMIPRDVVKLILGNNCHLEGERKISTVEGETYAHSQNMVFEEVSTKLNINCVKVFNEFLECVVKQREDASLGNTLSID